MAECQDLSDYCRAGLQLRRLWFSNGLNIISVCREKWDEAQLINFLCIFCISVKVFFLSLQLVFLLAKAAKCDM